MSPRRHRRAPGPTPIGDGARQGSESVETGPDGEWRIRRIPGGHSDKTYRCPGCDQEVSPGVAHLVAWPADGAVDERRHWHAACWRARDRRRPNRRRHPR